MIVRPVLLLIYTLIFCSTVPCSVANATDMPKFFVETDSVKDGISLVAQPLDVGRSLMSGDFGIRASVQLPLSDQRYVVERMPLELGDIRKDGIVALSAPSVSPKPRALLQAGSLGNHGSKPNLLDADELWLTYRAAPGSLQCGLSVDIEAQGVPYNNSGKATPPAVVPLKVFSRSQQIRSVDVDLRGVKVLPRDVSYLIKRQTGMSNDHDWRVVEESNRRVVMRLLRVDLRDINSIELEMDKAVEQVNFRLSRRDTGKPTDILVWDAIPKEVVEFGDKRRVRLDFGRALKQQLPGALAAGTPLTLVEVVAYVPKGTVASAADEVPIRQLRANYIAPVSGGEDGDIELPAQLERVGPEVWRWRLSLAALHDTGLGEVEFLRGRIVPKGKHGCIAAFERAEFVSLATRKLPVVLADVQKTARSWGGPFGLVHKDADEIEWPQLLAHYPLGLFSGGRAVTLMLPPGERQVWAEMGLSVTSRGASPLAVSLDAGGLHVKGAGDIESSWAVAVSLPDHAYLSVRPVVFDDAQREGKIRLRFSDGHAETLPYSLGEALSLRNFAGKRLVGADLLLHLPDKGGAVSIAEMALFTLKVVKTEQAMKEPIPTWDWQAPANLWLHSSKTPAGTTWEIAQAVQGKSSDLAALRVRHGLSYRPKLPCWLELTLEGESHSIRQQVCPVGLEGETVLSLQNLTEKGFAPGERVRQWRLQVVDGALPPDAVGWLQADYAVLNSAPIADRLLDACRVKLGGMELAPKPPTKEFWRDLAKGRAWLDYGDMRWSGGEAKPLLAHLDPMLGEINEWKFVYRGGLDAHLQAWLSEPPPAAAAGNPFDRWLKLGLVMLLAAWAVILWRRGCLLRNVVVFWSSLLQLLQRLSWAGRILAKGIWNFLVAQRQVINLLAVLMLWAAGLRCLGQGSVSPLFDKLPHALVVLALFAGLNMWRWHLEDGPSKPGGFLRRWIVGHGVWPPRIIWVVAVMILVFMLGEMVSQLIATIDAEARLRALIASGSLGTVARDLLIGSIALVILSLRGFLAFAGWVPIWLAVLYGLMPWLGALVYWMTSPNARWARWLVIVLGLYAVGLTHIGQPGENYYFTFGGMAVVVAWRIWMGRMRGRLQLRWPSVAEKVYGGFGSIYFSGALVGLAITALLLIPRLDLFAEQVAVVVYYCLVVGTVLEIVVLRRAQHDHTGTTPQKQSEISA